MTTQLIVKDFPRKSLPVQAEIKRGTTLNEFPWTTEDSTCLVVTTRADCTRRCSVYPRHLSLQCTTAPTTRVHRLLFVLRRLITMALVRRVETTMRRPVTIPTLTSPQVPTGTTLEQIVFKPEISSNNGVVMKRNILLLKSSMLVEMF